MLERPLDHSVNPQPVTSPAHEPSPDEPATDASDPWRQMFGRASQHLDSTQTRRLRSAVQQRLFDR